MWRHVHLHCALLMEDACFATVCVCSWVYDKTHNSPSSPATTIDRHTIIGKQMRENNPLEEKVWMVNKESYTYIHNVPQDPEGVRKQKVGCRLKRGAHFKWSVVHWVWNVGGDKRSYRYDQERALDAHDFSTQRKTICNYVCWCRLPMMLNTTKINEPHLYVMRHLYWFSEWSLFKTNQQKGSPPNFGQKENYTKIPIKRTIILVFLYPIRIYEHVKITYICTYIRLSNRHPDIQGVRMDN